MSVALQDRDLDRVVRSVVLRKRPDRAKEVEDVLDRVSGEISRQLAGSAIAPTGADRDHLVADYPLLPARRRLWERFLRAVDTAGRAGQLRTQLRVVLDATREVAGREVGVVVPGDRIYDEQESALQQSGALPAVTAQLISDLATDSEHGLLGSRVAKAVFIIGKLPKDGPSATGLRATNDTIADLLIEDLRTDGARIRERVPVITKRLAERGVLLEVDGAYLLQTPAAAEWAADYQAHVQDLRTDVRWQSDRRAELLREAFGETERTVKPRQGKSLVARKVRVAMGSEEPKVEPGEIPVWVRDGWSATEREVRDDAQRAGTDSPLVLGWIPKEQADELARGDGRGPGREGDRGAASRARHRGRPQREGRPHLPAGRRTGAASACSSRRIVAAARVFQGGGNEVAEPAGNAVLGPSLIRAVDNAVLRLFPDFARADDSRWEAVIRRAKDGAAEPLTPLGHHGEVDEHPVPKAILAFLGMAGKRGQDVRRQFEAPALRLAAGRDRRLAPGAHRGGQGPGPLQRRPHDRRQAHPEHHGRRGLPGRVCRPDRHRPDAGQGPRRRPRRPDCRGQRDRAGAADPRRASGTRGRRGRRRAASCTPLHRGDPRPRGLGRQRPSRGDRRREGRAEGRRRPVANTGPARRRQARAVAARPAPRPPRRVPGPRR